MISIQDAEKIVRARNSSKVAFFHLLGNLEIISDFGTSYSLDELRKLKEYNPQEIERQYRPIIKILNHFREAKYPLNKKILDYGAGIGNLARYLQETNFDIETADNQPVSVVAAREINGLDSHLVNENGERLKSHYGIIMLNRILEQPVMSEKHAANLLRNLSRNLDTHGCFLISTNQGLIPIHEIRRRFKHIARPEIVPTETIKQLLFVTQILK